MLYGTSEKSLRKYSRSTIKVYFIFLIVKQARRFCHLPFCNSCLASKSIFALLVLDVSFVLKQALRPQVLTTLKVSKKSHGKQTCCKEIVRVHIGSHLSIV